ncbi:hypothetical protein E2562_017739 [Oryza meyeriana var. granulata]|uniref:F-box associated beta-propeller type 3 domain-containing protein n=1 Tax=Oryza meyeriana var. granulata TaxID=110450 RepID=A0A6G1BXY9_9ORYZ|nr:hypothetical protein E2562_017739 [Oryza meyeriana var. granulata]
MRYCDEEFTSYSCGCEVFTLGSRAWQSAFDSLYAVKGMVPLCFQGAMYWSAGSPPATQRILCFDQHNEEFTNFPPPPCMELEGPYGYLTELGGKLCYVYPLEDTVQLWVVEDGTGTKLTLWSLLCIKVVTP